MDDGIEICFNNNTNKTKYLNIELPAYSIELRPQSSWKVIVYDDSYDFSFDEDDNYCLFLDNTMSLKVYEGVGEGKWRLDINLS